MSCNEEIQVELSALMEKAAHNLEKAGSVIRHWCREDEYCTDIAKQASLKAMEEAGVDPADIELIIFTGMSKAFVEPATANVLQHELGALNANVIDTQDACSSFIKSIQDEGNTTTKVIFAEEKSQLTLVERMRRLNERPEPSFRADTLRHASHPPGSCHDECLKPR